MQSLLNEGYENLEAAVGEWHAWSHLQGLGKINLPKLHAAHVEQLVSAAAASLCWCPASLASLIPEFAQPADRYVYECPTNSRWLKIACHLIFIRVSCEHVDLIISKSSCLCFGPFPSILYLHDMCCKLFPEIAAASDDNEISAVQRP